jgi:hypothetical protein
MGCIVLKDVRWSPPFAEVENRTDKPLGFDVALPMAPGKRRKRTRHLTIKPGKVSPPVHLRSVLQLRKIKGLAKKKAISLVPLAHIGPRVADYPSVGSYGADDVYICYDCGKPIKFRYHPPVPIHI